MANRDDRMFVVKVYYKNGKSPWALTLTKPDLTMYFENISNTLGGGGGGEIGIINEASRCNTKKQNDKNFSLIEIWLHISRKVMVRLCQIIMRLASNAYEPTWLRTYKIFVKI